MTHRRFAGHLLQNLAQHYVVQQGTSILAPFIGVIGATAITRVRNVYDSPAEADLGELELGILCPDVR